MFAALKELSEKVIEDFSIDAVSRFLFVKDSKVYTSAELRKHMCHMVERYNKQVKDKITEFTPKTLCHTGCATYAREEYAKIYEEERGHGSKKSSVVVKKLDSQSLNLDSGDNQSNSIRENKFNLYGKKMQESGVSQKLVQDASVIYDAVNEGECFRRSDSVKLLGCSPAKAAYLINAMKASKVIEKVNGIGNGWYRFIKYLDKDEM